MPKSWKLTSQRHSRWFCNTERPWWIESNQSRRHVRSRTAGKPSSFWRVKQDPQGENLLREAEFHTAKGSPFKPEASTKEGSPVNLQDGSPFTPAGEGSPAPLALLAAQESPFKQAVPAREMSPVNQAAPQGSPFKQAAPAIEMSPVNQAAPQGSPFKQAALLAAQESPLKQAVPAMEMSPANQAAPQGSPFKQAALLAAQESPLKQAAPAMEISPANQAAPQGSPFKLAALLPLKQAVPATDVSPANQAALAIKEESPSNQDDRRRRLSKQIGPFPWGAPGSPKVARRSVTPPLDDDFYNQYSLDDMRRLAKKMLDLGILESHQIAAYVQDDVQNKSEVLCTYDSNIQWTTYNIKNQDFTFPHFMKNPVYLSRGGFGTVVKCFRYGTEPVAVKKVDVPDKLNTEMALRLLRELVIMKQAKKVNHHHICKIIDIFGDPRVKRPEDLKHIFIVMPLYKPGSLDCVRVQDASTFKTIAGHTLAALHFLHLHKIMHRDIKKENIFFDVAKNRAYLADLGQARTWNAHRMSGNGEVGTRCYVSPEILQGHHYDFRSDIYSLGQTWFEVACMMSGHESLFPYVKSGGSEHVQMQYALDPAVYRRRGPTSMEPYAQWAAERWSTLTRVVADQWKEDAVVQILEHMLQFDPTRRADTKKLFSLPYFFPFVTEDRVMDLGEVDTHDYAEIKQRIFDLQHGSCSRYGCDYESESSPESRRSRYSKMCSKAVQYFIGDKEGGEQEDDTADWWLRK